jgi:hypothetical protein
MFCALRSKLASLISRFVHRDCLNEAVEEQLPELEGANPWQDNLRRLAKERLLYEGAEPEPVVDEVTSFVNDLAHAAGGVSPEAQKRVGDGTLQNLQNAQTEKKSKRVMDGTVQDIRSWYGQALATGKNGGAHDRAVDPIDQKRRLSGNNRWFK